MRVMLLALLIFMSGCDLQRLTVNQTADVLYQGSVAIDRESDPEFAEDAIPASLKTLETFLVSAPDNAKLLEMLAKGYYSYAFGFIEADLEQARVWAAEEEEISKMSTRAVGFYLRSRDYGFDLVGSSDFEKHALAGDEAKVKALLQDMEKEHAAGLFWVGSGWASAINLSKDDSDLVGRLNIVELIMDRVLELDENYFDAGVHTFFGVLYGSRPPMFGGDPDRAKLHFEKAMAKFGTTNHMIPYLYARFWAVQAQDGEFFNTLMRQVATNNPDATPDKRLNNTLARQRAQFWLDHREELIFE